MNESCLFKTSLQIEGALLISYNLGLKNCRDGWEFEPTQLYLDLNSQSGGGFGHSAMATDSKKQAPHSEGNNNQQ